MKKFMTVAFIGIASVSLNACEDYSNLKADPQAAKTEEISKRLLKKSKGLDDTQVSNDPLKVSDGVWTGSNAVRMRRGQPLPKSLESDKGMTIIAATPMSLGAMGAQISATSGIPVRLADDANTNSQGGLAPLANTAGVGPSELNSPMTIAYEGPLSTLLDQVGSHFNLSWRYDGSNITFFRYETRTFVMESMPGTQSITDGIQSSQSQSGSSGSTTGSGSQNSNDVKQDSELKVDLAFWDDLKGTIQSILGTEGRFTTAPSSGTVTVSTTPDRMRSIASFIQQENIRLGRQVAINVEVFAVSRTDSDNYGLDLNSAFNSGNFSATPTGALSPVSEAAAGSVSFAILNDDWNISGVVSALSSLGKVAAVTRMPVTTLNNRPATRKITVDQSYLAAITTTLVANSGAGQSTALTPGVVSTGITLQMLPRILADGRIMLQYSLKMSELQDLKTYKSSSASSGSTQPDSIQLPEVANKVFVQQALLGNGSTLVLAGFDQDDQRGDTRGIGDANFWLLGGGFKNSRVHQYLVIAITPREVTIKPAMPGE